MINNSWKDYPMRVKLRKWTEIFLFQQTKQVLNIVEMRKVYLHSNTFSFLLFVACEYSRLSSLPAPKECFVRETSATYSQKFHTPLKGQEQWEVAVFIGYSVCVLLQSTFPCMYFLVQTWTL